MATRTIKRHTTNISMDTLTKEKLNELKEAFEMSQSDIIRYAINSMHKKWKEIK